MTKISAKKAPFATAPGSATALESFHRVGIMNDYVRIPYANGSSFASQFLYREFTERGHEVTVIGPKDPMAKPEDLPPRHVSFPALPLRNHPGVHLPLPGRAQMREVAARKLDIAIAHSTTELNVLGVWLRHTQSVPFLTVQTVHMPSVYNVLLPESLHGNPHIDRLFMKRIIPWVERHSADVYNQTDGLVVLSHGLRQYWRDRGVTAPIHVIPRAVDPKIFSRKGHPDPFPKEATRGDRLLCVCRHTREKGIVRLLEIFARHIAPERPRSTLTLVGDGPDHDSFRATARRLGVAHRVFFPGEFPVTEIPAWYRNADLFVYASLSETYGQVVSESMWCGLPMVAFEDHMGVSHQIDHGVDGMLIDPTGDEHQSNTQYAKAVLELLGNRGRLDAVREKAQQSAFERSDPDHCIQRYYDAFGEAKEHLARTAPGRGKTRLGRWPLLRWPLIHATVCGMGLVRKPALVNRHGRKQPSWEDLLGDEAASLDPILDRNTKDPKELQALAFYRGQTPPASC